MESVREKIAYVRGLIDSQRAQLEASGNLRLWEALVDALESVDAELANLDNAIDDQYEYLTAMDEDLADLEDEVYGIQEEADEDGSTKEDETADTVLADDGEGAIRTVGVRAGAQDGRGEPDGNPTFVAVECPHCHARLFVEEELLDEPDVQVSCPECEHPVYTGEAYHEIGAVARNGKTKP
ncbi:MAG: hypothetical protein IMX00_05335 [Limnochordales bacterium]|nr:hypothetical protein [Limnochordales bacterium]